MTVIVVGSAGQDGSYLCEQMAARGQRVVGIDRRGAYAHDDGVIAPCAITSAADVDDLVGREQPVRIFYLAAHHGSSEAAAERDSDAMERNFAINVRGLECVLAALTKRVPSCRLFYASSSLIFGEPDASPQSEDTPLAPAAPYAVSKVAGMKTVAVYRDKGVFAACGILYNHESPRRRANFVTQRIARAVVAMERGETNELVLGNLDATVDWGYAPEYTDAMSRILDLPEPGDYVVASGRGTTIRELVAAAFACADMDWMTRVRIDSSLVRPDSLKKSLIGDSSRLRSATGWRALTPPAEIIRLMIDAERERRAHS